jgi:tRNA(Arg) A34 adenosine deaminase TadA
MSLATDFRLGLPAWAPAFLRSRAAGLDTDEASMRLAIDLAMENVRRGTGGPFGALVVASATGELISAGVNRVTESHLSIAHAEIMALCLAEESLGDWNLSRGGALTLVTTCEPCAMCFGAIPWAGVRRLVCGSRKTDAEAAGFDEGEKPADWRQNLAERGIEVRMDVLRQKAIRVFDLYATRGGEIYNVEAQGGR